MKILFVHCVYQNKGGAEVTIWHLMRALVEAGHQCKLIATKPGLGTSATVHDGIEVVEFGLKNIYWPYDGIEKKWFKRLAWHSLDVFNIFMKDAVRKMCMRFKPDVASVHNLPGWSIVVWDALKEAGVPTVQVLHDYYLLCAKGTMYRNGLNCEAQCAGCHIFRSPHRKKSRQLAAVVGISQFVLERHHSLGYFEDVPIHRVIYNARHAEQLGLSRQLEYGNHECFRFGFIGHLARIKGIRLLIDEFLSFAVECTTQNIELWIAGTVSNAFRKEMPESPPNISIRFLGRVTPEQFYPKVDIVVVPSLWHEPLGMVVAEAMCFGKPVIAARRGGIPEMVADSENGLLFDPEKSDALRCCLERVMRDKALLRRLTLRARPSVEKFLDTRAWGDAYLNVYRAILRS
jgi:glycosyltransferase involved in cell wall biosynthesis